MAETEPSGGLAISVIIPVHNGAETLNMCLESVYRSDYSNFEAIVVDDRSTDNSIAIARSFPCVVIELPENAGPATARNAGVRESSGRILFFLDADIVIPPQTLRMIVQEFRDRSGVSALFGSYTKHTPNRDFVSRYKNLLHHYTHQTSCSEAATFCGGFGAIRRDVFERMGGFDPRCRFLEDIDLGYRLHREGYRIWLYKELQMTHCKRYTLASLIRSDLIGRAIPWTRLMLETQVLKCDLNLKLHNILSVPVAYSLLLLPWAMQIEWMRPWLGLAPAAFVALNFGFLRVVQAEYGFMFAVKSCLMSWFAYLYSGLGFLLGLGGYCRSRLRATAALSDSLGA